MRTGKHTLVGINLITTESQGWTCNRLVSIPSEGGSGGGGGVSSASSCFILKKLGKALAMWPECDISFLAVKRS